MKTAEEKRKSRQQRIYDHLCTLTIGSVFNKHPSGLACLFQKLVRLEARDNNGMCKCVTCGVVKHWQEMDAGHYIGRSNKATILDPMNVNVQCVRCNQYGSGEREKYAIYLIDRYGIEAVEKLCAKTLPRNHVWDRWELAGIKMDLLDRIKAEEAKGY
jgi:hypothetical protein